MWVVKQKALQDWVCACTGYPDAKVIWAQQQGPRPQQDAIVLRIMSIQDHGMPWVAPVDNPLTFDTFSVTVNDVNDTFTKVGHGLLTGDGPVRLGSTGTWPGNTEEDTDYWVIKVDDDTFKLATGFLTAMSNTAIGLSDSGTGTFTIYATSDTLRQGEELAFTSRSLMKCWLNVECYTSSGAGLNMAQAVLWRLNSKRLLPTPLAILKDANIGVIEVGRVRAIAGIQDVKFFEPRAIVDVLLHITSEEAENGTIIERTEITDETNEREATVDGSLGLPTAFDTVLV